MSSDNLTLKALCNHNRAQSLAFQKNEHSCFLPQLEKYSTTILSAMMAGMDDKDDTEDEITLESMSGLAKILAKLDENNVRQILINICLRIRPCFEKVSGKQTGITSAKHFFNNDAIVSLSGSTHDLIVFSCRPCFRRDTTCTVYMKS